MENDLVFSWAENANGEMVHVDSVPNGLACNCICPHCHEPLVARHGKIKEHGFAHHSENRRANLSICYEIILYKLAEHILQTKKRICVPSYYGIFKATDIDFVDVKIDSRYEREDKQPDVIATTKEGVQYLIEFTFEYKVQHKRDLDYNNLTCIEVDLSEQTLESLEKFLISSAEKRRWINNENYFKEIEQTYLKANKTVKVVNESDCSLCEVKDSCCAIKQSFYLKPLQILNSGETYRICKTEEYNILQARRQEYLQEEQRRKEEIRRRRELEDKRREYESRSDFQECSCFCCVNNLSWGNRNGKAKCGVSLINSRGLIDPKEAETCKRFKKK